MVITIGSLFSGIGGFELGLERAMPNSKTIWQVEQDSFCQKVLKKHWPDSTLYDDVRDINKNNVAPVDVLCGGFPCQDISIAGKGEGLNGQKSSLWWEMHRIICELRPRIVVMENVSNVVNRGLSEVLGSLASIGYDAEWCVLSAAQFGAPHLRKRWFCVAYSNSNRAQIQTQGKHSSIKKPRSSSAYGKTCKSYWSEFPTQSPICYRDDGVSYRLAKLRALGNAIVPQCSQWVGEQIVKSGLLGGAV